MVDIAFPVGLDVVRLGCGLIGPWSDHRTGSLGLRRLFDPEPLRHLPQRVAVLLDGDQAGDREGGELAIRRVRRLGLVQVNEAVVKAELGLDIALAERVAALAGQGPDSFLGHSLAGIFRIADGSGGAEVIGTFGLQLIGGRESAAVGQTLQVTGQPAMGFRDPLGKRAKRVVRRFLGREPP